MVWEQQRLGSLLLPEKTQIQISPGQQYEQVTVRLWGKGLTLRGKKDGSEISADKQVQVRSGQFLMSKIDARHGAFGLVPKNLDGAVVSNDFPCFSINRALLVPEFLNWFSKTEGFIALCKQASIGSTNRVRLKETQFLDLSIPLPPLEKQREIVTSLDCVQKQLQERKLAGEQIERDADALLFNAFQQVIDGAEYRSMAKAAPQVRRPISVDIDGEYPELGVRSFGKGTFHKPTLTGADVGAKRIYQLKEGDLVFSNVFSWEGAIAVAKPKDDARVGSHRFITCVPDPEVATSEFLCYYFLTTEGMAKIGEASPGGAGRNRTLGLKKLEKLLVPTPTIEKQRWFDQLCAKVHEMKELRLVANKDADALIPAMLHEIFERPKVIPDQPVASRGNVVALPEVSATKIDTSFKEAVLVGAIIKAFHDDGGQPLGNFRLQKGVYFARRYMGEQALDQEYLRKAAGPYNPSMRYSGGISIAAKKKWITSKAGTFGKGQVPGQSASEMDEWIETYQLAKPAAWVLDKFKFRKNDQWELLATVDYVMLALGAAGQEPTSHQVLEYIENDPEWEPKVAKLNLTEARIQNAVVELQTLFS